MAIDIDDVDETLDMVKRSLETARAWVAHPKLDAAKSSTTVDATLDLIHKEIVVSLNRVRQLRIFLRDLPVSKRTDV